MQVRSRLAWSCQDAKSRRVLSLTGSVDGATMATLVPARWSTVQGVTQSDPSTWNFSPVGLL